MKSIQHFELNRHTASRFEADMDCCVRVTAGRVWLTVAGHIADVWLDAGAVHQIPRGSTVWLSAEPSASIAIVATFLRGRSRRYVSARFRLNGLVFRSVPATHMCSAM